MATSMKLLVVPPKGNHTATVIFMHGLGDSGYGWKPVADQLSRDSSFQHIKWVLPHAPTVRCTANGGMPMPGWFDILSFDFKGPEDETGILYSRDAFNNLIEQEIKEGIPADRIVIGGFSQGAAMTLVTGLTTPHKLAGLTILSGWFAIRGKVKELLGQHATTVPIFWGHGADDPLIPLEMGKFSKAELEKIGGKEAKEPGEPGIFFKEYPGLAHSADTQEIDDWASWLKKVIPSSS
ncbi:Phospholipase/carboxylesterase [Thelephora terrestris]|uniref:Acyl-protein thioesterase 1 n=1 Tax=Thelephora terrestris TaxID=56493 RepID=A0A9P6H6K7_9AGAM|nr:Phospholipase/carboxylesterase [Thelephora terrestris]